MAYSVPQASQTGVAKTGEMTCKIKHATSQAA